MRTIFVATFVGILLELAPMLRAADPWDAPSFSADAKAIAEAAGKLPLPDDSAFEVLLNESHFTYDELRRCQTRFRLVYRVLNEAAAREASFVEAAWAPWHQERAVLRARVITAEGRETYLDVKHVAEVPAEQSEDVLTDRRRLRAPLPAVRAGSIIEREIVIKDTRPFFEQGSSGRVEWDSASPQRLVRLTIEAPAKLPLRYETRGFKLEPRRTEEAGRVTLVFESEAVKPPQFPELLQPPQVPRRPHIAFSTGESWAAVAKAYHAVVEKQLSDGDAKQSVVDLLGKGDSREQLAGKILARVQQSVRYTALAFGEAAIVPRGPAETLRRQFGDCKDQSALLVAMLRAAGLEAHVALLHTGAVEEIPTELPGLGSFNHAIVHVAGEPPLWIDPTALYSRIGELPLSDQGKPILVASASSKGLLRTPVAPATENRYVETQEVDLTNPAAAKIKFTIEAQGSIGQERRGQFAQQTAKSSRKQWEDFIQKTYRVKELSQFSLSDPHNLSAACRLEAEAVGVKFGSLEAGAVACTLQPLSLIDHLPFVLHPRLKNPPVEVTAAEPRKTPLALIENHACEMVYRYVPPAGFTVAKMPENKQLAAGPAKISRTFEVAPDNVITVRFHLDTGSGKFTAAEVEAFRDALGEIADSGDGPLWNFAMTFEFGAARNSAEGRHREAFVEFRRLLEKRPEDSALRTLYALALLRAGFGEAARGEACRAVELDPKSAEGWHQLGFILTHDLVGRHFRAGLDYAGALAAYQRGLELAPDHESMSFDQAILLERDQDGLRLSPDVKPDAVLEAYRRATKKFAANEQLRLNYLLMLLDLEQFDELSREAGKQPQRLATQALALAALAAEKGSAAVRDRTAGLDGEARRKLLLTTGDYMLRVRKYTLAKELWELGASGAPNEPQIRRLAAAVTRSKRHEEALLPLEKPGRVVQDLYVAFHRGGQELRDVRRLFANPPPAGEPLHELDLLRMHLVPSLRMLGQDHVVPLRRADVVSFLQLNVEGDDATGYRIRAKYDQLPPRTWFVVKRNDGYKLWHAGRDCGEFGGEALRAIAAGNLEEARQYLKWAYDELRGEVTLFDVYAGTPFARLWSQIDPALEDDLKLAASALMSAGSEHAEGVKLLLALREKQSTDSRKLQIDRALLAAGPDDAHLKEALEAAERMLAASPRAYAPFARKLSVLELQGDREKALQLARARVAESPSDTSFKVMLGKLLGDQGQFQEAEQVLRPLAVGRNAERLANQLAWNALFLSPIPESAVADARLAVEIAPTVADFRALDASLHTLAAVYVELDKPAEAHETLLRAMEARGNRRDPADNYVWGRLAEQYGLADVAKSLFANVEPPKHARKGSTWDLTQRRLGK